MRTSQKIENLEIYRGICALMVVIWHYFAHINIPSFVVDQPHKRVVLQTISNAFFELSTYAVLGFFVISGYVITRSVVRTTYKEDSFGLYFINRFIRLSSLCTAAVLFYMPLSYIYREIFDITTVWPRFSDYSAGAIITSMVGLSSVWNGPGWTLLLEWVFYAFVAIPFLLLKPGFKNLLILGACYMFLSQYFYFSIESMIYVSFVFGIIGLLIHYKIKTIPTVLRFVILGCSVIAIGVQIYLLPNNYEHMILRCLPLLGILLFAFYSPSYTGRIYEKLLWLGRISFSLYIWHFPIFMYGTLFNNQADNARSGWDLFYLTFILVPIVFTVSHFSYLYIERNARLERIPPLYRLYLRLAHKRGAKKPIEAAPW